jgi:inner membrane transporter RhtA
VRANSLLLPSAAILVAMLSLQLGASLAKSLFPLLGPRGATALRLLLAALILLPLYRPWRGTRLTGSRLALLGYGASMGLMNLFYYLALARVPMGLVVAIEVLGPLTVAIAASRHGVDAAWVGLALLGLGLLLPLWPGAAAVDPLGIGFALLAGVGWALYIVLGRRAGLAHGGRSVSLGLIVGALVVLPISAIGARGIPLAAAALPVALAVAVLSSALPYVLEMWAMTRLPTRTFGIFMSVEPALAALVAWAMLGERLTRLQGVAIGCVMLACFGSAMTASATSPVDREPGLAPP